MATNDVGLVRGHVLSRLPEISADNVDPGLFAANMVKIEVIYSCVCGETLHTSERIPQEIVLDVHAFSDKLRQITARSRDRWDEHQRG